MFPRRFPFVRQSDSSDCGVACLCMLARHYRLPYDRLKLVEICNPTNIGTSLVGISRGAKSLGLEPTAARITLKKLRECPTPCILFWNNNHYVVLYRIASGRFYIADPAIGCLRYSEEEILSHWVSEANDSESRGIAVFFTIDEQAVGRTDHVTYRNEVNNRPWQFIRDYILRYKYYLLHIVLSLTVAMILQLIAPFLTQSIVDLGIKNRDISLIWLILIGEVFIVVGQTATSFVRHWLLLHISTRINIKLVSDFLAKLMRLPMAFFENKKLGDLLQRMSDFSRIEMFLTNNVLGSLFSVVSMCVFAVVLLWYSPTIFGVFCMGAILQTVWQLFFLHRRKILDYKSFGVYAKNNNVTYELLTALQEIKLHGYEKRRRWGWENIQAEIFKLKMKSLSLQQTQDAGSLFIRELQNLLITVIAATAVVNDILTLGGMLAIQYVVGQISGPLAQLLGFVYEYQDTKFSVERVNEISRLKEEQSGEAMKESDRQALTIENMWFKYNPNASKWILQDINLRIEPGKLTAIVGASGSGKTTLIKLLLGFYQPQRGEIKIGRTPMEDIDMREWRQMCGVVMQNGYIFSDTIERNIAGGDEEIDRERLERAAETACIAQFVNSLPLGFRTFIGRDGMDLSQGQKQRILIARAVYRDCPYIFLDEATNSLDTENERNIITNLSRFYQDRTVIVVAHRLSTVKDADKIIVIKDGRVEEEGAHSELIACGGEYYNLIRNQLELDNQRQI